MTLHRCGSLTTKWQSPPRIFSLRKKQFVFAGTATRIRRCLRNSPPEKIPPMEQSSTTTLPAPRRIRSHWKFSTVRITSFAVFPAPINRFPWRNLPRKIPFRCTGSDRNKYFPRNRECIASFGICTTPRRMLSNTNFRFLRSIAIRPAIRWAHGSCPALTPRSFPRAPGVFRKRSASRWTRASKLLPSLCTGNSKLKNLATKAGKGALADAIAALDKKCAELEGAAQSNFFGVAPGAKPPENFSTLNQHFGGILAVADSADAAPTTQATAVYKELQAALQDQTARWGKIREQDIPALNVESKKAGLAAIDPSKAPDAAPSADADSDDEP